MSPEQDRPPGANLPLKAHLRAADQPEGQQDGLEFSGKEAQTMLRRRKTNLFYLLMLVIIAVAVGSAFTAANVFDAHVGTQLGYGTQNVSGAHVTSMHYTLHANGVTVDTVTFVALGDLAQGVPQEHGFVGFTSGGIAGPTVDCGVGVYDNVSATTFTCDVTSLAKTVSTIQATDIAVSN